jgi:hypothetical protein
MIRTDSLLRARVAAVLIALAVPAAAHAGEASGGSMDIFSSGYTASVDVSGGDGPFLVADALSAASETSVANADLPAAAVWQSNDPAPFIPGDLSPCPDCSIPEPSTGSLTTEGLAAACAYLLFRRRRRTV